MTDERLRELERRWKETQSVEDEAAYLLERVRTGNLAKERLELTALLGHEASLSAIGLEEEGDEDPASFLEGVRQLGDKTTWLHALYVLAGLEIQKWLVYSPNDSTLKDALGTMEDYLDDPSEALAEQCYEDGTRLCQLATAIYENPGAPNARIGYEACSIVGQALCQVSHRSSRKIGGIPIWQRPFGTEATLAEDSELNDQVVEALLADFVPFFLGLR